MPEITFARLLELLRPAFAIAMLGAIESLLSAVVADGMAGTKHDSNQELVGQGIANMVAPFFGGFAATGAIARTASNVRNGGNSPLAGMVHAAVLLLIILLFAPYAAYIPLAALAAILFMVAYNMSEMRHFFDMVKGAPKNDVAVLLITFLLTVLTDLVFAVNVGVILASLLFMKRMAESVQVRELTEQEAAVDLTATTRFMVRPGVQVYSIDGPFFFGAAEMFENTMETLHESVEVLVLRLGRVPFIDATAMHSLRETIKLFQKRGTRIVLCEANERVKGKLAQAGILDLLGAGNLFDDLPAAMRSAGRRE